jgi:predicted nucleic acid-binding protein
MSETAKEEGKTRRVLTIDSNVFIASLKGDEPYRKKCLQLIGMIPDKFVLCEPSIVYEEVCGTIARRIGISEAREFSKQLDRMISTELLFLCDRDFCLSSYPLCLEYGIYSIDALYLNTAIASGSILVSLDDEEFVSKVRRKKGDVEVYQISNFPYF